MSTDFDPYDDEANWRRAQESWRREQAERRLQAFRTKRPIEFAEPGDLHPDIEPWIEAYLARGRALALIIIGAVGAGKTWSLWKIQETLIERGWRGRCEIASSYELKEATDRPVDHDQVRVWREADLLCIDDIGSQRINDWDMDALHALIDTRRQHHRATVITSNSSDLRPLLGERVASRLAGGATAVVFTNGDRRRGQQ
ncbi:hypothetical protein CDO52_12835 [Nocardiopsis gilva YIM 90087]|uniref:IstB-like ATP-binding domain-containing protein n=1 Tax=Nocardiopsis gilva YIM 90087 TaxID=1235441 RepID=A0A223S615_9ACTN|nr:ATP-binding protein [Nocardiopsis gilva]ASU83555.1 hypothetical protein CDO52_12835 [Nocardiopsis gilva YIM 90087]